MRGMRNRIAHGYFDIIFSYQRTLPGGNGNVNMTYGFVWRTLGVYSGLPPRSVGGSVISGL